MIKKISESLIKDFIWFCFLFLALLFALVMSGCATGPLNQKEMSPVLSSLDGNPREGLIILEGEPAASIEFRDQAGCLVAPQWNEAGASPLAPTYNGQRRPRLYAYSALEFGSYTVKIRPFYYTANLFLKRQLVELPVQTSSVYIDRRTDDYDGQYTGRHWGWILRINTGNIPRGHFSGPKINISGTGLPGLVLNRLFGR